MCCREFLTLSYYLTGLGLESVLRAEEIITRRKLLVIWTFKCIWSHFALAVTISLLRLWWMTVARILVHFQPHFMNIRTLRAHVWSVYLDKLCCFLQSFLALAIHKLSSLWFVITIKFCGSTYWYWRKLGASFGYSGGVDMGSDREFLLLNYLRKCTWSWLFRESEVCCGF